jgi:exopolysaccharide production protein ExoZ
LLFVIAIFSARLALTGAAIWLVAILVQGMFAYQPVTGLLSSWNLYFLAGMGVLWLGDRISLLVGPSLLAAGVILCFAFPVIFGPQEIESVDALRPGAYFALAFGLIVLGSVTLERRGFAAPAVLRVLGDASYSIYLVHSAAISGVMIFAQPLRLIARIGPYPTYFLTLFVAVAAGLSAYFLIEKPLLRSLRKFTPIPRDAGTRRTASAAV